MSTPSPAHRSRIAPNEKKWWLIAGIASVIGLALALWFGISANQGPSWTDRGYIVVNDQLVKVNYELHGTAGRQVTCTVRALDIHFGTVGSVQVHIPATADVNTSVRSTSVQTIARAVTAEVQSCAFTAPGAGSP